MYVCLLTNLLYSTSTRPSFKMSWPMPLLAMPTKALLLRTKSVWLFLLRSVTTTLVPCLVHRAAFLHLICKKHNPITIRNFTCWQGIQLNWQILLFSSPESVWNLWKGNEEKGKWPRRRVWGKCTVLKTWFSEFPPTFFLNRTREGNFFLSFLFHRFQTEPKFILVFWFWILDNEER